MVKRAPIDVLEVALTVIASLGGGGLIVLGLSSWLGKTWATRIMERERAELERSIQILKADLAKSLEQTKVEMQEQASQQLDAITRKREVYGAFVTASRALLGKRVTSADQEAFLAAYSRSYLWASEEVALSIQRLIELLAQQAASNKASLPQDQQLIERGNVAFKNCMLAMRRDVGFLESNCEFRPVTF